MFPFSQSGRPVKQNLQVVDACSTPATRLTLSLSTKLLAIQAIWHRTLCVDSLSVNTKTFQCHLHDPDRREILHGRAESIALL